jgi:hypothetical protein
MNVKYKYTYILKSLLSSNRITLGDGCGFVRSFCRRGSGCGCRGCNVEFGGVGGWCWGGDNGGGCICGGGIFCRSGCIELSFIICTLHQIKLEL